ncbi:hypothetical protein JTB14_005959 [Gonioctena quinquepunctata]|nr:hypothetical protein JTB14_005959 [Gonioctena quinquepunctata]
MAHGLNFSEKKGFIGELKEGEGQRKQRATARKYGIHRRQIQSGCKPKIPFAIADQSQREKIGGVSEKSMRVRVYLLTGKKGTTIRSPVGNEGFPGANENPSAIPVPRCLSTLRRTAAVKARLSPGRVPAAAFDPPAPIDLPFKRPTSMIVVSAPGAMQPPSSLPPQPPRRTLSIRI